MPCYAGAAASQPFAANQASSRKPDDAGGGGSGAGGPGAAGGLPGLGRGSGSQCSQQEGSDGGATGGDGGVLTLGGLGGYGGHHRNSRLWSAMSFGDTSSLQNALDAFCKEEEQAPPQPFSLGPEVRACVHTRVGGACVRARVQVGVITRGGGACLKVCVCVCACVYGHVNV